MTISPNGVRCSTAESYLKRASKTNLNVMSNKMTSKVIFDDNYKAIGIEVIDTNSKEVSSI